MPLELGSRPWHGRLQRRLVGDDAEPGAQRIGAAAEAEHPGHGDHRRPPRTAPEATNQRAC